MPRASLSATLIASALVVVTGCQTRSTAKPNKDGGAAGDAGALVAPNLRRLPPLTPLRPPEPAVEMPRELRFTLLEPGQGARKVLRYRPDGSARELVARALVTTRGYADGVWTDPLTLAPLRDGFGITAAPPASAGAAAVAVQLRGLSATVEAGGPAAGVAAAEFYLERWRLLLEKRRADITTDARGRILTTTLVDDPARHRVDARDELVQRWLGLVVPLPEEPIAVGARWRVVSVLRAGGAVLKQTATYRLTAADAAGWTVVVEVERIGEPQDITVPGMAAGVLGEVVALRRVVTGTLTVRASDPLPVRGKLTSDVASHARFHLPGKTTERYTEDQATIELGPP